MCLVVFTIEKERIMIENKQNMTISNWFSQNRKILYWSLFIATFDITIKPITATGLVQTIC